MANATRPTQARRRTPRGAPAPTDAPRCSCGAPLVQDESRTLNEVLGPKLGALVGTAVAADPPGPGQSIEVSPDKTFVQWYDDRGCRHELYLSADSIVFAMDEDADDDDEDDEDEGAGEQVA